MNRIKDIPELKEGQVFPFMINGEKKYLTFKPALWGMCRGCVFRRHKCGSCEGARCSAPERSDGLTGVFVEIELPDFIKSETK